MRLQLLHSLRHAVGVTGQEKFLAPHNESPGDMDGVQRIKTISSKRGKTNQQTCLSFRKFCHLYVEIVEVRFLTKCFSSFV